MNGLLLKNGMTAPYRAFCDGRLSCTVEKYGGINSISWIDILEKDGKLYPDRAAAPIFSRRHNQTSGRVLYSPAIRFLSEDGDGRVGVFHPARMEVFPWGFRSSSEEGDYDLLLDGPRMIAGLGAKRKNNRNFILSISRLHLVKAASLSSMKNQMINGNDGSELLWRRAEEYGDPLPVSYPCENGRYVLDWEAPVFGDNVLFLKGVADYPGGRKEIHCAFAANVEWALREPANVWALAAALPAGKRISLALGVGGNHEDALAAALDGCRDAAAAWKRKLSARAAAAAKAASLAIRRIPQAREFVRQVPAFQDANTLAANGDELCVRAAADKYAYFAMWDHVYPIRDFLLAGRLEDAKRLFRYMLRFPHIRFHTAITQQLVLAFNEIRAFGDDPVLAREAWEHFRVFFRTALAHADDRTGLVSAVQHFGCDSVREFGIETPMFRAPCVNGWWHNACRVMENMAMELDDRETARTAGDVVDKIDAHYLSVFYDPDAGYLRQADGAKIQIHLTPATLGLDYIHGEHLFRRRLGELANYQATRLYHPAGHVTAAYDSDVVCEMWKSTHMNQHIGHECRLARHAGHASEAYRVLSAYLSFFDRYKAAVETFNLAGCEGNDGQLANWQTFSATSAQQGLYRAAGIEWHRGGILYVPAEDEGKVEIRRLVNNGAAFDIHIDGKGAFVGSFTLNGKVVRGTMQVPADGVRKGTNRLEIVRSRKPFAQPVLLSAPDARIRSLECGKNGLAFVVDAALRSPIRVHAPSKPRIRVNGKPAAAEWIKPIAYLDRVFAAGDTVEVI